MATKQMNISFQVNNNFNSTNAVEITLGNATIYTGTLPETGPIITGGGSYTTTNITVDIDVPVATSSTKTSTLPFSMSVAGGEVQVEDITTNYNYTAINTGTEENPTWVPTAGTAEDFATVDIVSQPLWNGVALIERYNIEYNQGPIKISGPGEVQINANETVEFDILVSNFNNTVPLTS